VQRSRRAWAVGGGLALTVLAALAAASFRATGPVERYQTALIGQHDIEDTVVAIGKIRPRAHVDVGARVSGQLRKLHVRVGSLVREGDLLAEIDAEAQEAKVEGIRAELSRLTAELAELEAGLVFAQRQHERQAELSRSNAVSLAKEDESRRDMDVAKARMDATNARIRQTEASLQAEKVALGYTRIVAPMAGTVVSVEAQEGQTLNANYEAPDILQIADLAVMTVWAEVSETDVTRLSVGMPVNFTTLGHRDRVWSAALREVLPVPYRPNGKASSTDRAQSKSNIVTYMALFDVENADRELRAEMTAQASFICARSEEAIAIPLAALQAADNPETSTLHGEPRPHQIRLLNSDGTTSTRDVASGVRGNRFVEAKSGVAIGERVIIGETRRAISSSFRIER
jgi:macrolide-specific efflux system membrane fusion protein